MIVITVPYTLVWTLDFDDNYGWTKCGKKRINMKKCSKCKVEKDLTEFSKDRTKKDGLFSQCKSCVKEYSKKYREANKEYHKEYYQANKERLKKHHKKYYYNNKEKISLRKKEYNEKNKDEIRKNRKKWYLKNKEKIKERNKKWYLKNKDKIKERSKKYERNRIKTDHLFKMKKNLRRRTSIAFKVKRWNKKNTTSELLGCDWLTARNHIERQFTEGMSWDNHGEWHIDHIIPLASANNEAELKKLCHYSNLQPLWAEDNLSKSDKI